jgi:hypothetical protein
MLNIFHISLQLARPCFDSEIWKERQRREIISIFSECENAFNALIFVSDFRLVEIICTCHLPLGPLIIFAVNEPSLKSAAPWHLPFLKRAVCAGCKKIVNMNHKLFSIGLTTNVLRSKWMCDQYDVASNWHADATGEPSARIRTRVGCSWLGSASSTTSDLPACATRHAASYLLSAK